MTVSAGVARGCGQQSSSPSYEHPFAQAPTEIDFRPTPDGKLTLTSADFSFFGKCGNAQGVRQKASPKGKSLFNQRNKEEFGG
jgi:hypothetical protein